MEEKLEQRTRDVVKVVLFGPESTGKTSLARELAAYYNTAWVPEFSRDYLQKKWNEQQLICERQDILPIAAGQMELENRLAEKVDKLLICDTNLLETVVYSQAYFDGFCEPHLLKHALKAKYDLYFLMYIDVPWVEDDLRDRPHQRELMFNRFQQSLETHRKPYQLLTGNFQQRFDAAVKTIDKLLKHRELGL